MKLRLTRLPRINETIMVLACPDGHTIPYKRSGLDIEVDDVHTEAQVVLRTTGASPHVKTNDDTAVLNLMHDIREELKRARSLFPAEDNPTFAALVEEVGGG